MASKYWIKLYHEMIDDPKVMTLRPALRWRFIETLLMAGEMDEDGYLPTIKEYSWRVRDSEEIVETEFVELLDAGLLSRDDTRFFVTKFAERQAPISGAERVSRYRERKQKDEYYETHELPNGNDNVTFRYTDTDTDKIRIDTEEEKNKGVVVVSELYEHEIGSLTPLIREQIIDWVDNYPHLWLEDAIKIAAENNTRKVSYINGILKNWKTKGRNNTKSKSVDLSAFDEWEREHANDNI